MIKSAIILFLSCFLVYLPFSRHPDYFDSETSPAYIQKSKGKLVATFEEGGKTYSIPLDAKKFTNKVGSRLEVIYEVSAPENASINQAWGYWFKTNELLFTFGVFVVLLGVAYATTHRPDPSSLAEQLNVKNDHKTKYQ